jgi:hypothetical protein
MKTKPLFAKMTFCAFSLFLSTAHSIEIKDYEKKIKTNYSIKNVVDKISRKDQEDSLRNFLMFTRPSRNVGSAGHTKAIEYLEEKLRGMSKNGGVFSREEFSLGADNPNKGINLVWEKKGAGLPLEVLVLGAHFDTAVLDSKKSNKVEMPGADNNGSGVAALLSVVELLSQLEIPRTVKVVFFDADEMDQAGSKAFLDKFIPNIGNQRIVGFIDVTMIGHDSKREDKTGKIGNMKIYTRAATEKGQDQDVALANMIMGHGKRLFPLINFTSEELPATKVKDSASLFWQLGIPSIVVTQDRLNDFNPRFQTSNDFYETLNLMTYNNVFRYLASAVLAWNYDIVK